MRYRYRPNLTGHVLLLTRPDDSVIVQMSAASNELDPGSDVDEPMASVSKVRKCELIDCWHAVG
jgi:hypothetical protein